MRPEEEEIEKRDEVDPIKERLIILLTSMLNPRFLILFPHLYISTYIGVLYYT
jgi:hypothetical protein